MSLRNRQFIDSQLRDDLIDQSYRRTFAIVLGHTGDGGESAGDQLGST
jgi:hypothetical protein